MKQVIILASISLCLIACGRRFRNPGAAMEDTIKTGESFWVTPTHNFERNDIVVFNYYGPDYSSTDEETGRFKEHWEKRVYRLVAYSGDSVEMKNGELFINGSHIPLPPKGKLIYDICAREVLEEFNDSKKFLEPMRKGDTLVYTVFLTPEKAESYRGRAPAIMDVRRAPSPGFDDTTYARASREGHWTSDDYGPFRIPSPGESILVDDDNFKFYSNIPGIKKGTNTLKEKLYFLLGDNRYSAADSRFIGLIAHSNMYGVVK